MSRGRWSCSVARLLLAAALGTAGCKPVVEEPKVPGVPKPIAGTPSNSVGEERYKSEDYAAAAWVFEQLVAGAADGERARAQFWLGRSYFKLEDFERATGVFLHIVRGQDQEYRARAFAWLLALRRERPEDMELLRTIGEQGEALVDDEQLVVVRDELLVALGDHLLRTGRPAEALRWLQQVPEGPDVYGEAQLLAGLAAERLGRRAEAIERLSVAATLGAPTRRERRKGEFDAYEERVRERAARELERLGQPLDR